MAYIDFAKVKEEVSLTDSIQYLELTMKRTGQNQWRGPCPVCEKAGDRALVLTEGKGFYCFGVRKGGDVIALAAHVFGCPAKDAAQRLAEMAGIVQVPRNSSTRNGTVPESEGAKDNKPDRHSGMQPLQHLDHEHELLIANGLDPAISEQLGIGYATRGVVRGSLAIPIRDASGALLGYLGAVELTYVPPDFQTNVVPFKQRA